MIRDLHDLLEVPYQSALLFSFFQRNFKIVTLLYAFFCVYYCLIIFVYFKLGKKIIYNIINYIYIYINDNNICDKYIIYKKYR